MHIHVIGICGTFMGGLALLAREFGFEVSGSDANVYPPMSTQLETAGIPVHEGYEQDRLQLSADMVVVGNALSRGNPAVEAMLEQGQRYTSGPQWLSEQVLADRKVIAVAGTHGKTTTASMLAWILEYAEMNPGFLIGGVPENFGVSARLGSGSYFVVEADEYDTAFFDKRAKFVHYRPQILVLNNLEYDHADIFPDLAAIQQQFHYLVRTVPGNGVIIHNGTDPNLQETLEIGCWTPLEDYGVEPWVGDPKWRAESIAADGHAFTVYRDNDALGVVEWGQIGLHNVANGMAAIAAACHAGVSGAQAVQALAEFQGVKRRMELRGLVNEISVYDDFAHHPTAIAATLHGLRQQINGGRILAVIEPRSNTMRLGVHRDALAASLRDADQVWVYRPDDLSWDIESALAKTGQQVQIHDSVAEIIADLLGTAAPGDHIVIMSNGGFEGIHDRLIQSLAGTSDAS